MNTTQQHLPIISGHVFVNIDNEVYVVCGELNDEIYVYNIEKTEWKKYKTSGETPMNRFNPNVIALNHQIFIFGGYTEKSQNIEYYNDLHILDVKTFNWTRVKCSGDLPPPCYGSSIALFENNLYLYGGTNGKKVFGSIYKFDIQNNQWKLLKHVTPLYHHSAIVIDHFMYIFGGITNQREYSRLLYKINLETLQWTIELKGKLPPPRGEHAAVQLDPNTFMIAFGKDNDGIVNSIYTYNTQTMKWIKLNTNIKNCKPPFNIIYYNQELVFFQGGDLSIQYKMKWNVIEDEQEEKRRQSSRSLDATNRKSWKEIQSSIAFHFSKRRSSLTTRFRSNSHTIRRKQNEQEETLLEVIANPLKRELQPIPKLKKESFWEKIFSTSL